MKRVAIKVREPIIHDKKHLCDIENPIGYIYRIENLITGNIYIGKHHGSVFDNSYYGSGTAIQHAYKKYGINNFSITVLQWCSSDEELNSSEIYWIDAFGAYEFHQNYNLTIGGDGGPVMSGADNPMFGRYGKDHPRYGIPIPETLAEKLRLVNTGRKASLETRMKLSRINKGRVPPNKGLKLSDETKRKISISRKGKCLKENNPNYLGKAMSEELWERYRNEYKGKHFSIETEFTSDRVSGSNNPAARKVRCIESGIEFGCCTDASIYVVGDKSRSGCIIACCRGRQKTSCGFHWEYV